MTNFKTPVVQPPGGRPVRRADPPPALPAAPNVPQLPAPQLPPPPPHDPHVNWLSKLLAQQIQNSVGALLVCLGLGGGSVYVNANKAAELEKQLRVAQTELDDLRKAQRAALQRELQRSKAYECQLRVAGSALYRLRLRPPRAMPSDAPWVTVASDERGDILQSLEPCELPPAQLPQIDQ